jgi:poly(hydroxyalkanoate) granule-associated protein
MATQKTKSKQAVNEFAGQVDKVFLASLGVVANARKAGIETFEALVKDGEKFRNETSKKAEKMMDRVEDSFRDAGDDAEEAVDSLVTRIRRRAQFEKLEKAFDKRVADAMDRMNVPSKNDIDTINKKLNRILRVVDTKDTKKAPARKKAPAARKTTRAKATARKAA